MTTDEDATTMTTPQVRLELPPRPVSIAVGRSVLRRIVTFRDDEAESAFLVAFTEVLANAVDEHQRLGLDQAIRVVIDHGPTECVRVVDSGEGIHDRETGTPDEGSDRSAGETRAEAVDVEEVSERGRGLALARAFVGELVLDSTSDGTVATLPLRGFGIVR